MGPAVVRGLHATLRVDVRGTEHYERLRAAGQPVIFAVWHGRMLTPVWWHRAEGIVVLVSEHADGEALARIMGGLGFGSVRGSSTRGGVRGLKGLVRAGRERHDLAITPDGPRGPARQVKPGLMAAAQLAGAAVVPLSAASTPNWTLSSWDRFVIPRPRAKVYLEYGPPIRIPADADDGERARRRAEVQIALDALTERVDRRASAA